MNFLKLQNVYVVLWDAWNFRCIFKHEQDAINYVQERMFSDMYEIRTVTINDLNGKDHVYVIMAECQEFRSICPNDEIDWAGENETMKKIMIR
jgi:hypothetical protein